MKNYSTYAIDVRFTLEAESPKSASDYLRTELAGFDHQVLDILETRKDTGEKTYRKVGVLKVKLGIKGYVAAEVGDPVYEDADRYFVYMDNGKHRVNYYKDTLKPNIEFDISI
jgi:hypothetical protein